MINVLAQPFNFTPQLAPNPRPVRPQLVELNPPPGLGTGIGIGIGPPTGGGNPPISGGPTFGGGGGGGITCPPGYHYVAALNACIANATLTIPGVGQTTGTVGPGTGTTITTTAGGAPEGIAGEGPIYVTVNNATTVADNSANDAINGVTNAVRSGIQSGIDLASQSANAQISAVQYGIDNLTTQLAAGIDNAQQSIAQTISAIGNGVNGGLLGIGNDISQSIFGAINPVSTGLAQIIGIISQQIGGLAGAIGTAVSQVIPLIVAAVTGAISPAQVALTGIQAAIQGAVGQLAQIASGIGGISTSLDATLQRLLSTWELYNSSFVEAQTGYPDGGSLHKDLSGIFKAIEGLLTTFVGIASVSLSDSLQAPCQGSVYNDLATAQLDWSLSPKSWFQDFYNGAAVFLRWVAKIYPAISKYLELINQQVNQQCSAGLLSPATLVDGVLRGFLSQADAFDEAARGDLNAQRFKTLLDLATQQLPPAQLNEALYRGYITQNDYSQALAAQGFTPGQQSILQGLAVPQFRPAGFTVLTELFQRGLLDASGFDGALKLLNYDDAQRQALKNLAFRPRNVNEAIAADVGNTAFNALNLGTATIPPESVQTAGAAEGIDSDAAQARWLEHWSTGGLGLWTDLYFRSVITFQQLQAVYALNYIPDGMHVSIVEASRPILQFRTITRMISLKLISESEGFAQLKKHGYSDQDAQTLVNYAVATAKVPAAQRAAQTHAVAAGIAKQEYIDGSITAAQFYDVLVAHGWTPEGANTDIAVIDADEAMKARKANAQLIVDEYGAGLINEQVALAELAAQGLTVAELAKYSHKIRAFRVKNAKLPTESELLKMLKAGIITKDDYLNTLVGQGYAPKWANAFYELGVPANPPAAGSGASSSPPPRTGL